MKIAVFGTGIVGQVMAKRLADLGNSVVIGTRDVGKTMARAEKDGYGNPPFAVWYNQNKNVIKLESFVEAARISEMIFNCTQGKASIEALTHAGASNVKGKIIVDVSNPLDFSQGMPPSLSPVNTDSLGELIQRTFPDAKVVKTLNTMNCFVMVNPALISGDHNVFVSGNDVGAKSTTKDLLRTFGWIDQNIIDLGDITTARGTEQLLPIWIRLYSALQHSMFNFKIVVAPKAN